MTLPPPTAAEVSEFSTKLDALLSALNAHLLKTPIPASTPPAIYFTWDFVQRTKSMFSEINLDALVNQHDPVANEAYWDCYGRSFLINLIVHDQSGKADLMLGGPRVDFGEEVMACAKAMASEDDKEEGELFAGRSR